MKLKIGSYNHRKTQGGERFHFYLWKKRRRKVYSFLQYYKGAAGVRCSDRSHRSPSRCVFSSRSRTVCTSSGRVSKATQAAFVRDIR